MTNNERVQRMLDQLAAGLAPVVGRALAERYHDQISQKLEELLGEDRINANRKISEWDCALLLRLMWENWRDLFPGEDYFLRGLVGELRKWRNDWAHQNQFSEEDALRALDNAARLLNAFSANAQAEAVEKLWKELRTISYEQEQREERRRHKDAARHNPSGIAPWREVIQPHPDILEGQFAQSEFAADLWAVAKREAREEYGDPVAFFSRTYLTGGLSRLLHSALLRLNGQGGEPVVSLQTNFGGGKTHSMLALYNLCSGHPKLGELRGLRELLRESGQALPQAKRVVLVGNKISPGQPSSKEDGTQVHTLWGELAWQLGGEEAYSRIALDDQHATSPGHALRELIDDFGPALILIDEWVAYARQLFRSGLPGGDMETQATFAQTLSESVKLSKNSLLVISLPASDSIYSEEVGNVHGQEALARLSKVIGRIESPWQPATGQESFEIVRSRLFSWKDEDAPAIETSCEQFLGFYRSSKASFSEECRKSEYAERLKAAYPIHPEVFDRLYNDWSTLPNFQRTRGVLRLMAEVIRSLWEAQDPGPIILPGDLPLEDDRVRNELLRVLPQEWRPIVESEIAGERSTAKRLDTSKGAESWVHRRVARTVFLGSAPASTHGGASRQQVLPGQRAAQGEPEQLPRRALAAPQRIDLPVRGQRPLPLPDQAEPEPSRQRPGQADHRRAGIHRAGGEPAQGLRRQGGLLPGLPGRGGQPGERRRQSGTQTGGPSAGVAPPEGGEPRRTAGSRNPKLQGQV